MCLQEQMLDIYQGMHPVLSTQVRILPCFHFWRQVFYLEDSTIGLTFHLLFVENFSVCNFVLLMYAFTSFRTGTYFFY